jgi:hypothetical protein
MEKTNSVLLVEGKDEVEVIEKLHQNLNVQQVFKIINFEGIDKLRKGIPVRIKSPEFNKIGILLDADTSMKSRWESMRDILRKEKFLLINGEVIPKLMPKDGLIATNNEKIIGVWIMPNNELEGMLEDFIRLLIPNDDQLLPIAEEVIAKIETEKLNKYPPTHHAKALIHTWLAWQKKTGSPFGQAITANYLDTKNTEVCSNFMNWINRLFVETELS